MSGGTISKACWQAGRSRGQPRAAAPAGEGADHDGRRGHAFADEQCCQWLFRVTGPGQHGQHHVIGQEPLVTSARASCSDHSVRKSLEIVLIRPPSGLLRASYRRDRLFQPVSAQCRHPLANGCPLDVADRPAGDNQPIDLLGHFHHFGQYHTSVVAVSTACSTPTAR